MIKKKLGVMRLLHTDNGRYAISFILGMGLASLFRKICKDRNCLLFKAPPLEEVTKSTYAYGDKCYTFKETLTKCNPANKEKIAFE
jgi:hypothetical protein